MADGGAGLGLEDQLRSHVLIRKTQLVRSKDGMCVRAGELFGLWGKLVKYSVQSTVVLLVVG